MKKNLILTLNPKEAFDPATFKEVIKKKAGNPHLEEAFIRLNKRSIDARSRKVKVIVDVDVFWEQLPPPLLTYHKDLKDVRNAPPVIIVGMGPAGIFAALKLIELGMKPVIIERGKNVKERRRDLAAINKKHLVNPESNYCFGEGGAGTYSDGKLYTRSKKRGAVRKILETLVVHGADETILVEAHPHIGTNKLPKVIEALRRTILEAGGEILFNTKIVDLMINNNVISGVVTNDGEKIKGLGVILATGHSARDIFQLLYRKRIRIESKAYALGVRVEHAQSLIDKIQYHCEDRGHYLPASSYSLVHQVKTSGAQRGVFSFCMCPGGFIVPAATAPGEVVVNGMSPSRRDSEFANSGIVVAVNNKDFQEIKRPGPLEGMYFQQRIEQKAWQLGGQTQMAPAQRLVDFINHKTSATLLDTSYQPGLTSIDMREVLPDFISQALCEAFIAFGRKMKGYMTNDAQIIGVESRSSSPVKIPRDNTTLEHLQIKRLFPCGEGAGYAGGIVSAAIDGTRCAEALVRLYKTDHSIHDFS